MKPSTRARKIRELRKAAAELVASCDEAESWCDAHSADTSAAPDSDKLEKVRKLLKELEN